MHTLELCGQLQDRSVHFNHKHEYKLPDLLVRARTMCKSLALSWQPRKRPRLETSGRSFPNSEAHTTRSVDSVNLLLGNIGAMTKNTEI
jgi:hypothetical protein